VKGEAGMSKAIKESSRESVTKRRRLLIAAAIPSILLAIAILAGGAIWLLNVRTHAAIQAPEMPAVNNEVSVTSERQTKAQTIVQQYMTAFLKGQYGEMWSLLHPQVQAMWPGEAAFNKFWQLRCQDYTVRSFLLGNVQGLKSWVNPETMRVYTQVILLPVSLQIEPKPVLLKQAGLPPEDLHPSEVFRDLPSVARQVAGQGTQQ